MASRFIPRIPIHSESLFSTSFSLTAEVRRHMINEAGIGRRGKETLAAECGPRERHPFPACATELLRGAADVLQLSVFPSWRSGCAHLQSHLKY